MGVYSVTEKGAEQIGFCLDITHGDNVFDAICMGTEIIIYYIEVDIVSFGSPKFRLRQLSFDIETRKWMADRIIYKETGRYLSGKEQRVCVQPGPDGYLVYFLLGTSGKLLCYSPKEDTIREIASEVKDFDVTSAIDKNKHLLVYMTHSVSNDCDQLFALALNNNKCSSPLFVCSNSGVGTIYKYMLNDSFVVLPGPDDNTFYCLFADDIAVSPLFILGVSW